MNFATKLNKILCLFALTLTLNTSVLGYTEAEAKEVLNRTLTQFTHKGGAKIGYHFKVGKLFDRRGTFMFKDDKSLAFGKKEIVWNNGKTVWILDKKSRVVKIMNPGESRKGHKSLDEELAIVKNGYKLSMTSVGDNYCIHMKAIKRHTDIKQGYLYIDKKTFNPVHIRMKVAFIWATIDIWDFETANYKDEMFSFPVSKYPDVKIVDKRK
jgi:outer membrane lipoprotein-sorting protein